MKNDARTIQSVYINREQSWLKFNERVLEEACDVNVPLFERWKFIWIFMNNLDEFFMIRVGSLQDQMLIKEAPPDNKTGMTAREQVSAILKTVKKIVSRKDMIYQSFVKKLAKYNIRHVSMSELCEQDEEYVYNYYIREIFPLLSPQIIDNHHPFPFLLNKGIYVGVYFESHHDTNFGIIPAVGVFDRVCILPGSGIRFILSEDIIFHYADKMFSHNLLDKAMFRVTRNADIMTNSPLLDEDSDFRFTMKVLLKKRVKLAPVRLEVRGEQKKVFVKYLLKKLMLDQSHVFATHTPLDMSFVHILEDKLPSAQKKKLLFEPLIPQDPIVSNQKILAQVLEHDILLSYPYESMRSFIRLLNEASEDPDVVSLKITLYRVGKESQIIRSLITAAENGKDVIVVVELRARFDEEHNIEWAAQLTEAGCHVVYGVEECKVHSKVLLITKKTEKSIQYITQIGTGNYNERTAKLYTDLALITSNPEIGLDAVSLFNDILVNNIQGKYRKLLVAPSTMREGLLHLIQTETDYARQGQPSGILAKFNSLTDKQVIDKLIEASDVGVKIRLIIRGICCLRAGIPGLTENITVVSIVGRFLEHARVYAFGEGERRQVYMSSADWMTRNMERRIEVACPILDKDIAARVCDMLELGLRDNVKARYLKPDGIYQKPEATEEERLDSQIVLFEEAYKAAGAKHYIDKQGKTL